MRMSVAVIRTTLSPIDYTFLGESAYPIEFLFKFQGRLDCEAMRRSLERVLAEPHVSWVDALDRAWLQRYVGR